MFLCNITTPRPTLTFLMALVFILSTGCSATLDENHAVSNSPRKLNRPPALKTFSFERPPSLPELASGKSRPPDGEQLEQAAESWFYGPGLGRTMLNVGTVVVFPPYALYLLGNAGLALAGYEPLEMTDALPEQPREYVVAAYDGVVSVPGRITAMVAGRDFSGSQEPEIPETDCPAGASGAQCRCRESKDKISMASRSKNCRMQAAPARRIREQKNTAGARYGTR